ncbi:MAG: hypothetical protein KIT16_12380 [Rhodospirillaceae bacterium]|nr:hypothetical protein [Rhodospirillaceae bacterium]
MKRKSLAAGLAALSMLAAAGAAQAACFTRPGTPNRTRAELVRGKERDTIRFIWFDTTRADERVWHDIEVTDGSGRLVLSLTGVGNGAMSGKSQSSRDFGGLTARTKRCFRIKARSEQGRNGCVSARWSARVCATTAGVPEPPARGCTLKGTHHFIQSNNIDVALKLTQSGSQIRGSATFYSTSLKTTVRGSVAGTFAGRALNLKIYWLAVNRYSETAVYTGRVNGNQLRGENYPVNRPQAKTTWSMSEFIVGCN